MKIAIISDIHDNMYNLELAFKKIKELKAEKVFCLGDISSPFVAKVLSKIGLPVFMIWGNNEGDRAKITEFSNMEGSKLEIASTDHAIVDVEKRKFFLTHYPDLVETTVESGKYDAVFYGHNHQKKIEKIKDCLVLNPGEIYGSVTGTASFAMYDSATNEAEIIVLENAISVKSEELSKYLS